MGQKTFYEVGDAWLKLDMFVMKHKLSKEKKVTYFQKEKGSDCKPNFIH